MLHISLVVRHFNYSTHVCNKLVHYYNYTTIVNVTVIVAESRHKPNKQWIASNFLYLASKE